MNTGTKSTPALTCAGMNIRALDVELRHLLLRREPKPDQTHGARVRSLAAKPTKEPNGRWSVDNPPPSDRRLRSV